MTQRTQAIISYLTNMIEALDGNGLVVTDETMIREWIEACGDFQGLRNLTQQETRR